MAGQKGQFPPAKAGAKVPLKKKKTAAAPPQWQGVANQMLSGKPGC